MFIYFFECIEILSDIRASFSAASSSAALEQQKQRVQQ